MFMEPRDARVTSCRATGSYGEFLERTHYYESVSKSLQGNIEAIGHAVTFKWTQTWKTQEVHELKMPHSFFKHWWRYFYGMLCVFVVYCVLLYVVFLWCMCFLWLVCCGFFVAFCVFCGMLLFFVLWYVCVCLSKAVLECFFFSRRGEGDNLLDAKCDSSEEEGGIAGASEPDRVVVVTGDSGICLVNVFHRHHVVPTPSHARKVLCWITCCSLRCAVRRATLFLVFSMLGIVFPLTTGHLDVLSDDWPFGSK